jgi:PPK2 family polyphosphate:nucleotide phosphotransferase
MAVLPPPAPVTPPVRLADIDPDDDGGHRKADVRAELDELRGRLASLQERLYAEGRQSLLVVLQAMDTGGKDGTIKHVFRGVNPQGCQVSSFKQPTPDELSRDFLWRVHARTPADGMIGIFNRSHYEDVLIVRVANLRPREVWEPRFDHINAFEQVLAGEGTTIVKLFLHISRDEQRRRLQARLADPSKHWKFNPGDLVERARWDDYQRAYEDVLNRCSSPTAPWYVIPADRKWYRNLLVARILVATLERMDPRYPDAEQPLAGIEVGP